ncbi:MAG TPA: hypothetical protein VNY52_12080 [Solirubrobacteraceae bacterium]|nr:hypothetical protein [Solirubrobacteraceae bacterium]
MSRSVVLAFAGLALAVAPPAAFAKSGDVAATQALARATDTLVRAASPDVNRALATVRSFTNQIAAQCPQAAAGSPQDHNSEQLSNEVVGAMTAVGYRTAATPIAAFARAVRGLRWSNHRLTRAVRTFASKLVGLSTLATPNLCGDIEGWVAGGYATLPASTVQFDRHYVTVEPEAEESPLILRLAAPYTTPADLPILHRVEHLEAQLAEAEAHAVAYYVHVMNALALNP